MESGSGPKAVKYVVQACRASGKNKVWVQWLGYPERRSCWRNTEQLSGGSELPGIQAPKVQVSVRLVDRSSDAAGTPLVGKPIAEIKQLPKGKSAPKRNSFLAPKRAKKKPKKEYETKVHTIRVGSTGVSEIKGVRRRGGTELISSEKLDIPGTSRDSSVHAARSGTPESVSACASGNETTNGESCADPSGQVSVRTFQDERSQLWEQHRLLNEGIYSRPHGVTFRVEVVAHTEQEATLRWIFPEVRVKIT